MHPQLLLLLLLFLIKEWKILHCVATYITTYPQP